tara:strand:- start:59186 stop:62554 length:3369 start_codon:yes stop_codon:yes gene_type:complete
MNYKKLNIIGGWLTFLIATIVYLLTIEPTTSFWDCGEFIASAYKLEVGHPPGAPFFMLLARFFTLFVPLEFVPTSVNVLSALCSSFTILFLFWTVTAFAKKIAIKKYGEISQGTALAIVFSGVVGGLVYTFSDSFWFSAVEGEVYAMSSFFTALVFWAIMKYDSVADQPHSTRWLIAITYFMGLSIGVHLLNLLAIPAICFVYYFRNFETTRKGVIYTFLASVGILGVIQGVIIPGTYKVAASFEKIFVNGLGMGFFSGVTVYVILLFAALIFGLYYTRKKGMFAGNLALNSIMMILIGYSTFAIILIRSYANPPMDENNPEDVFALVSYLNREQYGDRPLIYGQQWMAPLDASEPRKDGNPVYIKAYSVKKAGRTVKSFKTNFDAQNFINANASAKGADIVKEYVVSDDKKDALYNYDSRFETLFPRMYSSQANHISEYKKWSKFVGKPIRIQTNQGTKMENKPTLVENLRYFFSYQVNFMYWRYFMWNFAGKQNDIQGHGEITHGNWITGVKMIDQELIGNHDVLPAFMENNKGYNKLFLLPFILGLIGLVFHFVVDKKQFSVVALLFFLTGLAIVIYLNQTPLQPRERDYAYVGSFYAFAIWVGLGVMGLYHWSKNLSMPELGKGILPFAGVGVALFLIEMVGGSGHGTSYSILYMTAISGGVIALFIAVGKNMSHKNMALMALILTLPIPLLMASQNWDDHSRAKRRTGVDFAKNYLDSCEPNAILFTNGDNDTFPLWYVQEVEGYRTDVRIVNLSLLNTDWYVDQMKHRAYDGAPVPISMDETMYRQGTRDVIILDDSRNRAGAYLDIDRAMDFVKRDGNMLPMQNGEKMHFLPSKTFSLAVDKEKVLANGTVAIEDTAKIVDRLEWTLNKSYILKNSLVTLDILATNNWERPIYFAVTTGSEAYIGLQQYFQLEGLAYRLVPIKTERSEIPGVSGRIASDIMYENMMNNFQWGNMDTEDVYMDENNIRMTTNLRLQFSNLAESFIRKGDKEMAKKVLDRCLEVMPQKNVPYTRVMTPIAENYLRIDDYEQAEKVIRDLFAVQKQNAEYYLQLDPEDLRPLAEEMQIHFAVANRLVQLSLAKNLDFAKELEVDLKVMEADVQAKLQELQRRVQRVTF